MLRHWRACEYVDHQFDEYDAFVLYITTLKDLCFNGPLLRGKYYLHVNSQSGLKSRCQDGHLTREFCTQGRETAHVHVSSMEIYSHSAIAAMQVMPSTYSSSVS